MRKQLLFKRARTLTAGGHPGGGITVVGRGDGLLIQVTDPSGTAVEVFLDADAAANLSEMMAENPAAWGGDRP